MVTTEKGCNQGYQYYYERIIFFKSLIIILLLRQLQVEAKYTVFKEHNLILYYKQQNSDCSISTS